MRKLQALLKNWRCHLGEWTLRRSTFILSSQPRHIRPGQRPSKLNEIETRFILIISPISSNNDFPTASLLLWSNQIIYGLNEYTCLSPTLLKKLLRSTMLLSLNSSGIGSPYQVLCLSFQFSHENNKEHISLLKNVISVRLTKWHPKAFTIFLS